MRGSGGYAGIWLFVLFAMVAWHGDARADDMAAYRHLNEGIIMGHVIPGYEALVEATAALEERAASFCEKPQAAPLAALRMAYHRAIDAWMGVQHIRFGPVELFLRYD